jgi:hypothetical protein
VILSVFSGEVVFDGLYGPISVQITPNLDWVVGTRGPNAVISYGPDSQEQWTVSSSVVVFRDLYLGSAFELPTSISWWRGPRAMAPPTRGPCKCTTA